MSYNTIAVMADDQFLIGRLTACAAEEEKPKPYQAWVQEHRWDFVATPGWIEAWESAEAAGTADIGANPDVITDAMILAAVEEPVDPPIDPPIDPPTSDNVWTSGATLTTTTDGDGTVWQVGTRTTTEAVRLLSLITGPELQPSSWYRFRATARQPSGFFLNTLAFRPDVSTGSNGVTIASNITIAEGESTLDYTFQTAAGAPTENAGIAFVSTTGAVGDFLQIRDDATIEPTEAPPEPPQPSGNLWLEDDFSTAPVGPMTSSYLYENWVTAGVGAGLQRASVVDDNGNRRVRISLPKGAVGADNSGSTWRCSFPGTLEATAEYWLRFDSAFDWTKGGKIPGLCGGSNPVGGDPDPNGFSARYMWVSDGRLILYLYWAGQEGQYGDDLQVGYADPAGTVLKQRIKMNTPGVADGELQVWNNGVLKLNRKDMKWRLSGASWKITSFYFNVFHGGNNADYAPDRNNWIDFDDVRVTVGAS